MLPQNKIRSFLKKLKEQTERGSLHWHREELHVENEYESDEEPVGYPCVANFPPHYLRISQVRYKYWTEMDSWSWDTKIVLDFVDISGKMLWRFPADPAIFEIYESVRFSTSGVSNAIESFLGEE
jgi:hypothetical protein